MKSKQVIFCSGGQDDRRTKVSGALHGLFIIAIVSCFSNRTHGDEFRFFGKNNFGGSAADGGCLDGNNFDNRGPCASRSRGTLFQWSPGTGFPGGPDLDEPLVTDRPDFTESSVSVGKGVVQIEFGYTYTYNNDAGESVRSQSFGEPLLRYGLLTDWLEFRIALCPVEERLATAGASNSTGGTEDLYTGFKIALTPQEGIKPGMAVIPQMNIPTGSNAFSSKNIEPGLNWIYAWEINDFISTAGSTQGNRRIDDTGVTYLEMAQSWTVAYRFTDDLGAYTEWFAIIPSGANAARTQHYLNGGFTFLINNNMQFDIRAGVGLNDAADDYFFGTGLSIRFP